MPSNTYPFRAARTAAAVVLLLVASAGSACSGGGRSSDVASDGVPVGARASSTVAPVPSGQAEDGDGSAPGVVADDGVDGAGVLSCRPLATAAEGRVERAELTEASGLVASHATPGVLWSHNDSGAAAEVFAFDETGRDLGSFALVRNGQPVPAVDVEDVALAGDSIYLADVGDNLASRSSVTVYRFAEPTPVPPDEAADGAARGTIEVDQTIEIRWPGGSTDAEALLVDPVGGDLLLLSKDLDAPRAPTRLALVPASAIARAGTGEVSDGPIEAMVVGSIDVAALTKASGTPSIGAMLYPGAVTGADISAAGDLIALRTYGAVWLFRRWPGQSLAEALAGPPCEAGSPPETQGESVAFLPPAVDDDPSILRYATVAEGARPKVNVTVVEILG